MNDENNLQEPNNFSENDITVILEENPNMDDEIHLSQIVSDDSEGKCSHPNCKLPTPNLWVECDQCKNWCHFECANIPNDKDMDEIPFLCPICISKPTDVSQTDFEGFSEGSGNKSHTSKRPSRSSALRCRANIKKWVKD